MLQGVDTDTWDTRLLVDGHGFHSGEYVTLPGMSRLDVLVDGPWSVTVSPLSEAESFVSGVSGTGDRVLLYKGPLDVAEITHDGSGDFTIWAHTDTGRLRNAADESGRFLGYGALPGKSVLVVSADGNWSITVP